MSWHCSQDEGEGFSLQNYLDSIPCARLKYEAMPENYSCNDNGMECSTNSQYGVMYQHSMVDRGEGRSTSSQVDSHARTLARRGKEMGSEESVADYGKSIRESLAKLGLVLSLPKIHHSFELEDLMLSSQIFPRWGMTHGGVCLELGISAKFINETECGYLPTPSGVNGGKNKNHIAGRLDEWGGSSNPFRKTEIGRVHCPRFEEWMMGWPETWGALTGFEMDKFQLWQLQHSEFYPQG